MIRKIALSGVLVLLLASLAGATTLVKMDFGDLAREANYVVVGTVTGMSGEFDPSGTFIRTNVTLEVERSFRGRTADTLVVRTPGGWVGGEGQTAVGAATFEIGERVLVFLTNWEEDGALKVLGYLQGKSSIGADNRLEGGSANGRSLESVGRELRDGRDFNISLRPAN